MKGNLGEPITNPEGFRCENNCRKFSTRFFAS